MSSFWKRIRTGWKLKSAIGKTVDEREPGHLSLFLAQNEAFLPRVVQDALGKAACTPWESLWICLSLVRLNEDSVVAILTEILESEFAGWKRIEREHVREILVRRDLAGRSRDQRTPRGGACSCPQQDAGLYLPVPLSAGRFLGPGKRDDASDHRRSITKGSTAARGSPA